MRAIPLTQGKYALVSDEDYERVSAYKWFASVNRGHTWYAMRTVQSGDVKRNIYLHRFVANAPDGVLVDHINHNGLDCRRENIRLVTRQQNGWNARRTASFASKYKGVTPRRYGFEARLCIDGKQVSLGLYPTDIDAARVYDAAAVLTRGEYAHINFHDTDPYAVRTATEVLAKRGIAHE